MFRLGSGKGMLSSVFQQEKSNGVSGFEVKYSENIEILFVLRLADIPVSGRPFGT